MKLEEQVNAGRATPTDSMHDTVTHIQPQMDRQRKAHTEGHVNKYRCC